jgi:hypothetical protein
MDREVPGRQLNAIGSTRPRRALPAAVLVLAALACLAVFLLWRGSAHEDSAVAGEPSTTLAKTLPTMLKWGKPDVALLLSAQQHGYLQPCGCSYPQKGGLTRRYNFLQALRKEGWPVVAVDLGDISQRSGLQATLKYTTSMKALTLMKYSAVSIGEHEMGMPLLNALGHYTLNNPEPPVLAANLLNKDKDQVFYDLVGSWRVVSAKDQPSVGIIGVVGQTVQEKVKDPDAKFARLPALLPQTLREIRAKKPALLVLLYQGSVTEAKRLAKAIPNFDVIVCLSAEEEPPSIPETIGNTSIITLGHKGRYVGLVGAYRTGNADKPFRLRYQLVPLEDEFETPRGQEKDHPVMKLMEDYAKEVKRNGFLAKAAQHQVAHSVQLSFPKAIYVGSEKCKKCHEEVYKTWKQSPHALAYQSLVEKAKNPSLRQYDSECIGCHVTGWGYKGGYTDEVKTKHLVNNGCENCHGPGSEHIQFEMSNDANAQKMRDLMNPYRYDPKETAEARKRRINFIDMACQKCHDIDNDVNWKIEKWWEKKIVHSADAKP